MKQNLQERSHALPHSEYDITHVPSASNNPILFPVPNLNFLFFLLAQRPFIDYHTDSILLVPFYVNICLRWYDIVEIGYG